MEAFKQSKHCFVLFVFFQLVKNPKITQTNLEIEYELKDEIKNKIPAGELQTILLSLLEVII